jgi:O-Antigen ligase
MRRTVLACAAVALVAGPTVIAFFAGGYFDRSRLIAALVAWTLVVVAALVSPRPIPSSTPARLALAGLLLLTVMTGLSILWAPIGGRAQDDLQRLLLYLAFLYAAIMLLRGPAARRWLEPAVLLGTLVVACYALSARLLPDIVTQKHSFTAAGRLEQPLSYWNALGLLAAMGMILAVRVAGDPARERALRAGAATAGVPLGLTVYLTYARGALAALAAGALVLLALAPRGRPQLRSIVTIVVASAIASVVATRYSTIKSLDVNEKGDATEGAEMLAVLLALAAGAAAVIWRTPRRALRAPTVAVSRPRVVLTAAAVLLVAGGFAVAVFEGTPEGTSPVRGADPSRLGSIDSNRYRYWDVALRTWTHHPVVGIGSGGFLVEWLKERNRVDTSGDAHSLYLETLAEFGVVGFAFLLLFIAGIVAGVVRLYRLDAGLSAGPAAVLAAFALHAALDWDWEMPAVSLVALLMAGAVLAWGRDEPELEPAAEPTAAVGEKQAKTRETLAVVESDGHPAAPRGDPAESPRQSARNPWMRATKGMLLLALAIALAAPATALAQSAGDEQYVDPFQNSPGGTSQGGGGSGGSNNSQSQTNSGSSQSAPSGDTSQSAAAADTTSGGDGTALPRTGLPLAGVVLAGGLLLGGGITLRRRA